MVFTSTINTSIRKKQETGNQQEPINRYKIYKHFQEQKRIIC